MRGRWEHGVVSIQERLRQREKVGPVASHGGAEREREASGVGERS